MILGAPLEPDRIYVYLFGPGFGESILLRVPPDTWVVVDSCRVGGSTAAAHCLAAYGASWAAAILTHPHEDHASGFEDVLGHRHAHPGVVGFVDPRLPPVSLTRAATELIRKRGVDAAFAAVDAIDAGRHWPLRRGTRRTLGAATLEILHPSEEDLARFGGHPNRLSSALLVEWEQARLLLGSDVETPDWESLVPRYPDLGRHHLLKVPHHCSKTGVHTVYRPPGAPDGPDTYLWIATPYSKGSKLPSFADGEGMDQHLRTVSEIHLTGLPVRFDAQNPAPTRRSRAALQGAAPGWKFGALEIVADPEPVRSVDHCALRVALDRDGQVREILHGEGSVVVER